MAEQKFIDSRGTWGKTRYSQYRRDRTVSDASACTHAPDTNVTFITF